MRSSAAYIQYIQNIHYIQKLKKSTINTNTHRYTLQSAVARKCAYHFMIVPSTIFLSVGNFNI